MPTGRSVSQPAADGKIPSGVSLAVDLFVQCCFRPAMDLSNLLSSKTYIRPFCFRPILVHFLFYKKKQKIDFVQYLGFFLLNDMQTPPLCFDLVFIDDGSVLYREK